MNDGPVFPLEVVFALTEFGSRLQAQRYRREHPEARDAEVEAAVRAWLHDRPGAPGGDGGERRVEWPRTP